MTDIGGTNARFALACDDGRLVDELNLKTADFLGLVEAARAYLRGRPIESAVLVLAGPVESDRIGLTNCPWVFSLRETKEALGVRHLLAINDFVAQALAIPLLAPDDLIKLGGAEALPERPIAVIGPGTGLGVAGLIRSGHAWRPIPTEGGHVSFAPGDEVEIEVLRCLKRRYGHVSNERLLSGPGLVNFAHALAEIGGTELNLADAAEVSALADQGSAVCAEAISRFCTLLGRAAGDLALTLGARGGVYLTGGMVSHLGQRFDVAKVMEGFAAKGRLRSYVESIPVHRVLRTDTGLMGAAAAVV